MHELMTPPSMQRSPPRPRTPAALTRAQPAMVGGCKLNDINVLATIHRLG